MNCPICDKYLKAGTTNIHHLYFPKKRFKGTRRGRMTIEVHVACHNEFNYFFTHNCHRDIPCVGCKYIRICCYADNWTEAGHDGP